MVYLEKGKAESTCRGLTSCEDDQDVEGGERGGRSKKLSHPSKRFNMDFVV